MISSGAEFRVIDSITMMALAKFLGHMVKIVVRNRIVQSIRLAGAAPVDEEVLAQPLPEGSPPRPANDAKEEAAASADPAPKAVGSSPPSEEVPFPQPPTKRRKCTNK